jgi:hypothetical protein
MIQNLDVAQIVDDVQESKTILLFFLNNSEKLKFSFKSNI